MSRYVCLLIVSLSLPGCGMTEKVGDLLGSPEEVLNPPAELTEFRPSVELVEKWSRNTGAGIANRYLMLAPLLKNGAIYVSDINGRLMAVDSTSGKILWNHAVELRNGGFWSRGDEVLVTGGPGYGENTILLGTSKGDVIAIDAENTDELWRTKVTSEVLSPPRKSEGIVVVKTLDGKIFGLDGKSGRRLWIYDRPVPSLTLRGTGAPGISNGIAVCGFDDGRLAALEINSGRVIWESSIAVPRGRSELERMVDINSTPVIEDGIIYVIAFQGQLAALSLDNGRMLWNREMSSHREIDVDDSSVYVTDDKSVVWAIDRFSGNPVWRQEGLLNRQLTGPVSIGNYVVVGDFEGYLHWLDKTTGAFAGRYRAAKDPIITTPVSSGRTLYSYTMNGRLVALDYR